jgi:hypothetical protein
MRSHFAPWTAALVGSGLIASVTAWMVAPRAQAAADAESRAALTRGFQAGNPEYKALGPMTFSPSGVLFIADDQAGAVFGVDLGEKPAHAAPFTKVTDLGATLGARMGTTAAGIQIKGMAVSPVSHCVYLSVRKTDGADQNAANPANYALFMVDPHGQVQPVELNGKRFGRVAIAAKPNKPYFGTEMRTISDIAYTRGRLFVGALSSEQFNSNLVSIPVPFNTGGVERYATSIYHVSHKRQETASPIETLAVYRDADKEYLMAAYVCTPVVRFNLDDLKAGETVKGTTVAELGSGNRPMEMIAYGKPGQQSLLLNNHAFGIMKVAPKIARESAAVNEQTVADRGNHGGTPYAGLDPVPALKGAMAYAASDDHTLLVIKPEADNLMLEAVPAP